MIALAHTNKHVGADGKAIYSGTTDIVDDSDCCFVIDKISEDESKGITTHTVEFSNIKARGDVSSKIGFTYEKVYGQQYIALLDSVKCLDKTNLEEVKQQSIIKAALNEDEVIIKAVYKLIEESIVTKDKIIKGVFEISGEV